MAPSDHNLSPSSEPEIGPRKHQALCTGGGLRSAPGRLPHSVAWEVFLAQRQLDRLQAQV